jgi:hypothetical protein
VRWLSTLWRLLSTAGTIAWLLSIGGASLLTGLAGWALYALDVIPTAFLVLLLVGLFCVSLAGIAWVVPSLLAGRFPTAAAALADAAPRQRERSTSASPSTSESGSSSEMEAHEQRNAELRKAARLVRTEIDYGRSMIRDASANGEFWSSTRTIPNEAWMNHNETLAREATASNAHAAAAAAYHEFDRLNHVVAEAGRQRLHVDQWHRLPAAIAAANQAEAALVVFDRTVSEPGWDPRSDTGS